MANKYELRRRALKESQGRPENPFASPRSDGSTQSRDDTPYTPPPPMDRRRLTFLLSVGLAMLIVSLYLQTAGHKFTVCDDNVYIYEKPQIVSGLTWDHVLWAFADAHEGNWHPLTWISHMLDWQLFSGGSWEPENYRYKTSWAGGHHLVSMLIHCVNAVLLFLALRLMTGTLWPSFVVATLFGIHPLRVESVAWAAERKDVLCGLFWMASMLAYTCYARRRPIRTTSFVAAFGIASILTIVFIRLLVLPDLSPLLSTVPAVVIGIVVVGTLLFALLASASWLTLLAEVGSYLLITLLLALGLMSKSMIVTLPCVFLLLDIWPLGRWKNALWPPGRDDQEPNLLAAAWLLVEKIPWFGLVYLDCIYTVYGQNKGVALNSFEGLPLGPRLLNAVVSCGEYLRQTVWPTGLAPFYSHPAMIPGGYTRELYVKFGVYGALLVVITGIAIYGFFCKRSFLAVGWFWYLGTLMPVIGIIQVGTQARADRYTYLPMIGVYLMVAWLLMEVADRWPQTRVSLTTVSVVALIALSAVTYRQVSYWLDSYKLFQHAVAVTDKNYFAYNHIGIAYDSDAKEIARTDAKSAQELFDRVSQYFDGPPKKLDDARRQLLLDCAPEDFPAAIQKLDHAQQQQLLFDYSAVAFKAAIDIKPDYDFGNNNLGVYYARMGQPEDLKLAEKYFRGALISNQRYADAFNNLAIVLARQGKLDEAIFFHKQGLGVRNDRASDHNNFCRVYMQKYDLDTKQGDLNNAKEDLDNAIKENGISLLCDPNYLGSWMSRAEIGIKQNDLDEAAKCVQKMIAVDGKAPETLQAEYLLGTRCLNPEHPRPDEAIYWYNQILQVNSYAADVYNARGIAYLQKHDLNHAKQDFEQVLRLMPQYPAVQERLNAIQAQLAK